MSLSCKDCKGIGSKIVIRQIGPGMIRHAQTKCNRCDGDGYTFCKDCSGKGSKIVIRQIGPGMIKRLKVQCDSCNEHS